MTENFYSNIQNQLVKNRDEVLLKVTFNNITERLTGQMILDGVHCYHEVLMKENMNHKPAVLIGIPTSADSVYAILACMAAGVTAVIPPAGIGKIETLPFIRREKIKTIFLNKQHWTLAFLFTILGIKVLYKATNKKESLLVPHRVNVNTIALRSYSSGSTGKPSAIHRSHKILAAQHRALKNSFGQYAALTDFPLFANVILHNLSLGIKTVLPNMLDFNLKKINAKGILNQIKTDHIGSMTGNVFYFKKILEELKLNPASYPYVQAIGIGGSPVPEFIPQKLKLYFPHASIYIIYGCTQAEPIAVRKYEEHKQTINGYCVGYIHDHIEIKIHREQEAAGSDDFGEIWVKGNHVVINNENGWLPTGDYGYMHSDGMLYLTARQGNEKIVSGYGHYQLEHVLNNLKEVACAAAIATDKGFHIFYVGDCSSEFIKEQLLVFPTSIIKEVTQLKDMPMDTRHYSKVLYSVLCKQYSIR